MIRIKNNNWQWVNLGNYSAGEFGQVRFSPSFLDRVLEGITLLVMLSTWALVFYQCSVPGGLTEAEAECEWIVIISSLIVTGLLGITAYCTMKRYKFPVRLTAYNIAMQCMLAVRCVRVLNICINLMFLVSTLAQSGILPTEAFIFIPFALMILSLLTYYMLAYRYK